MVDVRDAAPVSIWVSPAGARPPGRKRASGASKRLTPSCSAELVLMDGEILGATATDYAPGQNDEAACSGPLQSLKAQLSEWHREKKFAVGIDHINAAFRVLERLLPSVLRE